MEKTCANHPESMALAACKACDKSICLMCVQEEKDGTFCSEGCIRMFREVSGWVGDEGSAPAAVAATEPSAEAAEPTAPSVVSEAPAPTSVFEEMPEPGAAAVAADPEPQTAAAVQTPQRGIGNPCATHTDIRAKAFCAVCKKAICGLCIVETVSGMFCSDRCAKQKASKKSNPLLKAVIVLVLLGVLGAGGYVAWKEIEKGQIATVPPPKPDPIKPPVKPDPVKPDPVKPDPVKPDPVKPDPVKPDPVKPDPVKPPVTPVKPPVKPEPKKPPLPRPEPPKPTRIVHPWEQQEPGAWYRVKTTQGGKDTYTDFGLKSRTETEYVLLMQASTGGQAGPVQEQKNVLTPTAILGEETLEIEGRAYPCEIRASRGADGTAGRSWVLIQGRHTGAVLRNETNGGKFSTQRVWEHQPRVSGRPFECLVVEGEIEAPTGRQPLKTWFAAGLPLGALKIETASTTVTLVDHGDDWAQRPPFPK